MPGPSTTLCPRGGAAWGWACLSVSSARDRREIERLHAELDAQRAELAAGRKDAEAAKKRRPDWVVALMAVAVSLIGVAVGAWGSSYNSDRSAKSAFESAHLAADEVRAKEAREKRAQV